MTISGDEIKRAGAKNQTEFADLFELLRDLSDFSLLYVNTLELSSSDLRKIYPAALLLRSWTASQAVESLLLNGFNDDAFAAIRTMLEIEFQLSAIWKKPEITEQLVTENGIFRGRRLQNILDHKITLPDNFQGSTVKAEIQKIEAEQAGKKPLSKWKIAKIGGRLKDYEKLYSYLCEIDHVSPVGLAEYVEVDPVSKVAKLCYGNTPLPIQYAFLWNSSILLRSLNLACIVLEKGLPETFWELNERHAKLWEKYVTKVSSR